ncbi:hypothetical protein F5877DRAFT_50410, partial [Lentinula edodes]
ECVACTESLDEETPLFVQPCGHHYCGSCLMHFIETCINDDNLFPPKCCGSPMSFITEKNDHSSPMENPVQPFEKLVIGSDLRTRFNAKALELDVRPEDRVYCPSPRCSTFLGSPPPSHRCPSCFEQFCVLCKDPAHSETLTCPIIEEHLAEDKLRDLARLNGWQTCPGCKALVELTEGCSHIVCRVGCYHMTCLCHMQFCYLCAAPWKECECPQWEENRLLNAAEARVEQEFGAVARVAEPAVFQRRVEQRTQELRYYHDCNPHRWRHHQGGGTCEECGNFLPLFLKGCRNCHIMVCVRCMRNRL